MIKGIVSVVGFAFVAVEAAGIERVVRVVDAELTESYRKAEAAEKLA